MTEPDADSSHPPPPCPVCHGSAVVRRASLRHSEVSVFRCGVCTHTFAWPFPTSDSPSASAIATESRGSHTPTSEAQYKLSERSVRQISGRRCAQYLRLLGGSPRSLRILEVGCGKGDMGVGFGSLGHEYVGIDIDHRVVKEAKGRGIDARVMDVMDLPTEETFDVICSSQVLEHIIEPSVFLEASGRHLRPGGVLHVDVPNQYTLAGWPSLAFGGRHDRWGAIKYPRHCMGYTEQSLRFALSQVVDLDTRVFRAALDDEVWGQAMDPGLISRAYFLASRAVRGESLLVALAQSTDSTSRTRSRHSGSGS